MGLCEQSKSRSKSLLDLGSLIKLKNYQNISIFNPLTYTYSETSEVFNLLHFHPNFISNMIPSKYLCMIINCANLSFYLMSQSKATPLMVQCLGPISLSKSIDPM